MSYGDVSTLVVEWIEIPSGATYKAHSSVSTLVVEWIEIIAPATENK